MLTIGDMSQFALSASQMAAHAREHGGGSYSWYGGKPPQGPGFMVGLEGHEQTSPQMTEHEVEDFRAQHDKTARDLTGVYHGAWDNGGTWTQDLSEKVTSPIQTRNKGRSQKQEAAFALPTTRVREGINIEDVAKPWGGDVLLHMTHPASVHGVGHLSDAEERGEHLVRMGQNDSDPRFALPKRATDFSAYEAQESKEWDKVGGYSGNEENPVTLGDVLRKINQGRTMDLRGEGVVRTRKRGFKRLHEENVPTEAPTEQRNPVTAGPYAKAVLELGPQQASSIRRKILAERPKRPGSLPTDTPTAIAGRRWELYENTREN